MWTSTLLRPDGTEREITWSNMSFEIDGQLHGAAIFRDATEARQASRNAAALGQAAAQLAGRSPLTSSSGTSPNTLWPPPAQSGAPSASPAKLATSRPALRPAFPTGFADISLSSGLRIEDLPDGDVVLSGRAAVVPDAKARWLSGPRPDVGATLQELDWQAGVHVPLSWGEEVWAYSPCSCRRP